MKSSPTHASSNGLSEVFVKLAKRILQKAKDDNRDPYLPLLQYRNTPLKWCGLSPAQLLFSRRLRTLLPSTNEQLAPKVINSNFTRRKMIESQNKSKQHYNVSSRKLPSLKAGESVHVQREKNWVPAKVISQFNDRSFNIQTHDGAIYRRNRKYLNKTPAQTLSQPESVQKVQQAELRQTRSQTALSAAPKSQPEPISHPEPENVAIKIPANIQDAKSQLPPPTCTLKTRSGQEIRPNKKYTGDNWVK